MITNDIYFEKNYGKLYEKIEHGVSEVFEFSCDYGMVKNQFIKREIPIDISSTKYFDIITPYGYGGPVLTEFMLGDKARLIQEYYKEFSKYCNDNYIVSEFVRFHPLINNAIDFYSVYQVENIRKTVGTNLKDFDDPIKYEFSKGCRKSIRKAIDEGISYKVTPYPETIEEFKGIYYSTMVRNNASEYYFFDDDYFEKCLKYFRKNIVLVEAVYKEKVIAAGLYFISANTIYIHLSGTLSEYRYLSPAYILKYATALWGKENGYEMIHYGGGRSNAPDDSLYLFKKHFGINTEFEFFIGKKIWNTEIYNILCMAMGANEDEKFFPAYRHKIL